MSMRGGKCSPPEKRILPFKGEDTTMPAQKKKTYRIKKAEALDKKTPEAADKPGGKRG